MNSLHLFNHIFQSASDCTSYCLRLSRWKQYLLWPRDHCSSVNQIQKFWLCPKENEIQSSRFTDAKHALNHCHCAMYRFPNILCKYDLYKHERFIVFFFFAKNVVNSLGITNCYVNEMLNLKNWIHNKKSFKNMKTNSNQDLLKTHNCKTKADTGFILHNLW